MRYLSSAPIADNNIDLSIIGDAVNMSISMVIKLTIAERLDDIIRNNLADNLE
jgi:hypothetical protein